MPRPMTEREREAFLAEPRTAIFSVAAAGGRPPLAVPIHYAYEPGGDVTFFTDTQRRTSRKTDSFAHSGGRFTLDGPEPRVALPVRDRRVHGGPPGRAPSTKQILRVAQPHMGEEPARGLAASEVDDPETTMVLYTARPDRWFAMDFGDDAG